MYCGISNFALSEGRTLNWNRRPAACVGHTKMYEYFAGQELLDREEH